MSANERALEDAFAILQRNLALISASASGTAAAGGHDESEFQLLNAIGSAADESLRALQTVIACTDQPNKEGA